MQSTPDRCEVLCMLPLFPASFCRCYCWLPVCLSLPELFSCHLFVSATNRVSLPQESFQEVSPGAQST